MKHHRPRRPWRSYRNHRPRPDQPTRAQVAQSLRRLRTLCYLEWDLASSAGDLPRRMAVCAEAAALDEALARLKEQA